MSENNRKYIDFLKSHINLGIVTLAISTAGFLLVYYVTTLGILGEPAWQILAISGLSAVLGILYAIFRNSAESNPVRTGYAIQVSASIIFLCMSALWQNSAYVFAALSFAILLSQVIGRGLKAVHIVGLSLITIAISATTLYLSTQPPIEQLSPLNSGGVAGVIFVSVALLLVFSVISLSQYLGFRTLASRLTTTFIFTVVFLLIGASASTALATFSHEVETVIETLQSVTVLKQNEIIQYLDVSNAELSKVETDSYTRQRLLLLLQEISADQRSFFEETARVRIRTFQTQTDRFEEIFLLNNSGTVIFSTQLDSQGDDYSNQSFFQEGSIQPIATIVNVPRFGGNVFIIAKPFIDASNPSNRGVLVARASTDFLYKIITTDPGLGGSVESYVVNNNFESVSPLGHDNTGIINTQATTDVITSDFANGSGTYNGYWGESVLGYYQAFPELGAILITEKSQGEVNSEVLSIILVNISVNVFVILVSIFAIVITARSISSAIVDLVTTTSQFALGKFNVKASENRQDEIGLLGRTFNLMSGELSGFIQNLEGRVEERTRSVEEQAARLRAASEVVRDSVSAPSLEELLNRSSQLIHERFNLYHVGIFLVDNQHEFVVLQASPTLMGKRMIEAGYKLKVGDVGIVGFVASRGEARLALGSGPNAVRFQNSYLPNTQSEIALPLKAENRILGVLDVHNDQPLAFTQEDVAILQIMADQLATAIERARLLQDVERTLAEIERAYQQFTESNWKAFTFEQETPGYRFGGLKVEPLTELPQEAQEVLQKNVTTTKETANATTLSVPIKLRGQLIGGLNIKFSTNARPNPSTILMIEEISARLALALENSRLITETRRRADLERTISNISSRVGASLNVDDILRTAVEEIGKIMNDADVTMQVTQEHNTQNQ